MQCQNCGQENQEGAKYCIKCGKRAADSRNLKCPSCGKENVQGALFCSGCGSSMNVPQGKVGYGNSQDPPKPVFRKETFASSIALDIVLSVITCGIYWFFWQARQMRALNYLLKEQRFNFVLWFFVSILTCFLFNIYYEYIMAQAIVEIQRKKGMPTSNDIPVLSLILSIFGLHIITDAIQQNEINKFFEK
jgi:hypothetical protein